MMRRILFLVLVLFFSVKFYAQAPAGYYDDANGLTGSELKTALFNIISSHTTISYDDIWTTFESTDKKSDGTVWDIYSSCTYNFGDDQCGNYAQECDCYNREHSFPKSWFNDASPMYSDLFHIYPSDGYVNGRRSNYAYGEVSNPTYTSSNGCKLGQNTFGDYTGTVFEPADEYKGDLARTYFYMVTCYEDRVASWETNNSNGDAMLDGTTYPCFEPWALQLLLKWHHEDPVSQKEIDRNNAIYQIQGNRNPFIDHPEYVCLIWEDTCSVTLSAQQNLQQPKIINFYNSVTDELNYEVKSGKVIKDIKIYVFSLDGRQVIFEDKHPQTKIVKKSIHFDAKQSMYIVKYVINNENVITKKITTL